MNFCSKSWRLISWMFLGIVAVQALYCGIKLGSWLGLIALAIFLVSGFIYGRYRKDNCKSV